VYFNDLSGQKDLEKKCLNEKMDHLWLKDNIRDLGKEGRKPSN
jgi:hypothetical protein